LDIRSIRRVLCHLRNGCSAFLGGLPQHAAKGDFGARDSMNALIGPSKGALFAPVLGLLLYRGFVARKRIGRTVLVLGIFLSAGLPLLFMWRNDISVENLKKRCWSIIISFTILLERQPS